jgi:hypothetical protein
MKTNWIPTTEKMHPDKPGKGRYEQVPCLVVRKGEILSRQWNCEHLVWDTEDGDDYFCGAEDVSHWMPLPSLQTDEKTDNSFCECHRGLIEELELVAYVAAQCVIDLNTNLESANEEYMSGKISRGALEYVLSRHNELYNALHKAGYTDRHPIFKYPVKPKAHGG